MPTEREMFSTSGREPAGYADRGAPKVKEYCEKLPPVSEDRQDWWDVRDYIYSRGLDWDIARTNAWYPSREAGDGVLRVVIPATSRNPHNQFWQARVLDLRGPSNCLGPTGIPHEVGTGWQHARRCRMYRDPNEGAKRYQSPRASRGDAIIVVNPFVNEDGGNGTVLVEGPFDALAAAGHGYIGIALMGNTPSDEVLEHAAEWLKATPPATLAMDLDAVPLGAELVVKLMNTYGVAPLRALSPYPAKDLASMNVNDRHYLLTGRTPLPASDGGYVEDFR